MIRRIIHIDQDKCNGCGACAAACHEGAIGMVDGKARLLRDGRKSAGELADHFAISAAAVSRHLSVLKEADLIRDDRRGKFIFYELNASVLEEILLWLTRLKGDEQHVENP